MEYNFKYAIQRKDNGQVVNYCETFDQAKRYVDNYKELEYVLMEYNFGVKVVYTEVGGPWGYGHQEESFATYGTLYRCVVNLINWMKRECRVFGPNPRDIRDYFKNCRLYINGKDKSDWLFKQLDKMDMKTLYL